MAVCDITADRVRELLHYDTETGVFTWRVDVGRWGRTKAGTVTGSPDTLGYLRIGVGGCDLYAHRLAWLYMTGNWPNGDIDHVDGCPSNNSWRNLRDVSHKTNSENRRKAAKGKKSGLPIGVSIERDTGVFVSHIMTNGRIHSLGRHSTPEAAHAAYVDAKRKLHAGCTI